MPDPYATIADADPSLHERLAEVLELRAKDAQTSDVAGIHVGDRIATWCERVGDRLRYRRREPRARRVAEARSHRSRSLADTCAIVKRCG